MNFIMMENSGYPVQVLEGVVVIQEPTARYFALHLQGNKIIFIEWNQNNWQPWQKEKWNAQGSLTSYTPEGYQYKIGNTQSGYFMEPGKGQFKDGGRGDFNYVYVTKHVNGTG